MYKGYTQFKISPELTKAAHLLNKTEGGAQTYERFKALGGFSPKVFQDWIFKKADNITSTKNDATLPLMQDYLKYVAINFGLEGGVFTQLTPRQMIEGYNDPMLTDLQKKNLF